jgi:hypothetical protein
MRIGGTCEVTWSICAAMAGSTVAVGVWGAEEHEQDGIGEFCGVGCAGAVA